MLPLLAILLLGFGLRIYQIGYQDLWGDEAFSVWIAKKDLASVLFKEADTHPPLYYLMLHFWLSFAGQSEFAARFLSLAVNVLGIGLIFKVGQKFFGYGVGILASLILALSPFMVYYSQETRMYTLVPLLGLLSLYFMGRWMGLTEGATPKTRFWVWLGYFGSSLLVILTHYYAFFLIVGQNLYVLFQGKKLRRELPAWFAAQALFVLAYVVWFLIRAPFLSAKAAGRVEMLSFDGLRHIAERTLVAFSAGITVERLPGYFLALGFTIIVAVGLLGFIVQKEKRGHLALLGLSVIVPLALAWLTSPLMLYFFERYLTVSVPAFYLIAALGLSYMRQRSSLLLAAGLALIVAISAYSLNNYFYDDVYVKGRYGQMMDYISANAQPNDALILNNQLQMYNFEYYNPQNIDYYYFPRGNVDKELESIIKDHPRLWLVMFGNPAEYDPEHLVEKWLTANAYKNLDRGFTDAHLSLYLTTSATAVEGDRYPTNINFDDKVLLTGYSLNTTKLTPGGTLLLTLYWQPLSKIDEAYTVFTHLYDGSNRRWAQKDNQPKGGTYPTTDWKPGEVIEDKYGLVLPPDAPPGQYRLEVGLYLLSTLERLSTLDAQGKTADNRAVLKIMEVAAQ